MSTEMHALSYLLAYHVSLSISYEVLGFIDLVTFSFCNISLSLLCWPALVLECQLLVVVEIWVNMESLFLQLKALNVGKACLMFSAEAFIPEHIKFGKMLTKIQFITVFIPVFYPKAWTAASFPVV